MIEIDEKKCIGCGKCADICPGNLIFVENLKAQIHDVRDCWGCTACVKICPQNAICYRLAADLGGAGAKLFAEDSPQKLTWKIKKIDGEEIFLEVDKKQSNKF
jgi:adenylylsulfate reductase subunit B